MKFVLKSTFAPTGDQPQAIEKLTKGIVDGKPSQVLLGVTGSGKTFSIANVIQNVQRPTLVISHNKTLAAQLYQELRDSFPNNAVSYFVSYYDYYQPEAYIPTTDTYIAKETEINEEIDKLRLATTTNILTRPDTIVVASVSCIYNLGSPIEYGKFILELRRGMNVRRTEIMDRLLDLQYARNDYNFKRSTFRVKGEVIDIFPAYEDYGVRLTLDEQRLDTIEIVDVLRGKTIKEKDALVIYPAKHYVADPKNFQSVFDQIRHDLEKRVGEFKKAGKLVEAQRLQQRTEYDLKMIQEIGYVNGIENYSRYFDGRAPGDPPHSLLDYFEAATSKQGSFERSEKGSHFDHESFDLPRSKADLPRSKAGWLLIIDESHMTLPQLRGMYNGDYARKKILIEYGFRLPAAFDNRPLTFSEFMSKIHQTIYMSATPNDWEIALSGKQNIAEQLIRPTGVVDPEVDIRSTEGQIVNLMEEIQNTIAHKERVLVTTLTKRMAEDLSHYLEEKGIKVHYIHADVATLDRQDILDDLRTGKYDVIVGINLLREGLDLPEVSLVAILDADKEGFLRSKTSLIQIMGRAARRVGAKVILYADNVTKSMQNAISEVERRRRYQLEYNKKHNITPKSVEKQIRAKLIEREDVDDDIKPLLEKEVLLPDEREKVVKRLRKEMIQAAKLLDFETAALLRDKIRYLTEN